MSDFYLNRANLALDLDWKVFSGKKIFESHGIKRPASLSSVKDLGLLDSPDDEKKKTSFLLPSIAVSKFRQLQNVSKGSKKGGITRGSFSTSSAPSSANTSPRTNLRHPFLHKFGRYEYCDGRCKDGNGRCKKRSYSSRYLFYSIVLM